MSNGDNQRAHERHELSGEKILILGGMKILVEDISWGGMRAHTRVQVSGDVEVQVSESGAGVTARILDCREAAGGPINPDYPYHVRCQFQAPPSDPAIEALVNSILG